MDGLSQSVEIPAAASDHELLRSLAHSTQKIAEHVEAIEKAGYVTQAACRARHPGARRWLELVVLVATLVGMLGGGWRWLLLPAVERAERAALAAALPREPKERVVQEPVFYPVPQPLPAPKKVRAR